MTSLIFCFHYRHQVKDNLFILCLDLNILLGATIMLKILIIIIMKTLKRSSFSCGDSTQAGHPHQEKGQTRDLQTPCRSLCWPHSRSCSVFLPREDKTFPQELPCSSLAASAHSLRATAWLRDYLMALRQGTK